MTLVLSLATTDYVLQVSDRQLTFPDGHMADSDRNKVVIWPPNFIFSYTGLAHICGIHTDIWLYETLCNIKHVFGVHSFDRVLDELALNATQTFQKYGLVTYRHCFVVIGWVTLSGSVKRYYPIIATVSNSLDEYGQLIVKPRNEFSVRKKLLRNSASHLLEVTGQSIPFQAKRLIRSRMHRPTSAKSATELLFMVLQIEAGRNKYIGSRALIVNIPKVILTYKHFPFLIGLPSEDTASVYYVGRMGEHDQYLPPFVDEHPGMHMTYQPDDYVPPPSEPLSAIILTQYCIIRDYYGDDSWSFDFSDEYNGRLKECRDITSARIIPEGYSRPLPYYGLLVGVRIKEPTDNVIDDFKRDKRYVVILSAFDDPTSTPDSEWFTLLGNWFLGHGMPSVEVDTFTLRISRLSRKEIIEELNQLLRIPVSGIDFLDQSKEA